MLSTLTAMESTGSLGSEWTGLQRELSTNTRQKTGSDHSFNSTVINSFSSDIYSGTLLVLDGPLARRSILKMVDIGIKVRRLSGSNIRLNFMIIRWIRRE